MGAEGKCLRCSRCDGAEGASPSSAVRRPSRWPQPHQKRSSAPGIERPRLARRTRVPVVLRPVRQCHRSCRVVFRPRCCSDTISVTRCHDLARLVSAPWQRGATTLVTRCHRLGEVVSRPRERGTSTCVVWCLGGGHARPPGPSCTVSGLARYGDDLGDVVPAARDRGTTTPVIWCHDPRRTVQKAVTPHRIDPVAPSREILESAMSSIVDSDPGRCGSRHRSHRFVIPVAVDSDPGRSGFPNR